MCFYAGSHERGVYNLAPEKCLGTPHSINNSMVKFLCCFYKWKFILRCSRVYLFRTLNPWENNFYSISLLLKNCPVVKLDHWTENEETGYLKMYLLSRIISFQCNNNCHVCYCIMSICHFETNEYLFHTFRVPNNVRIIQEYYFLFDVFKCFKTSYKAIYLLI